MKKLIGFVLAAAVMLGVVPVTASADAVDTAIQARIDSLYSLVGGKYFNVDSGSGCGTKSSGHGCPNCQTSKIVKESWFKNSFGDVSTDNFPRQYAPDGLRWSKDGMSCLGFSHFAEWYIFKSSNSDVISVDKVGANSYSFNYNNVSSYAKIGDIFRLNDSHSVIFISANSSNISVLDSNYSGTYNCLVQKHTIPYGNYSTFTISRATNRSTTPLPTAAPTNVKVNNTVSVPSDNSQGNALSINQGTNLTVSWNAVTDATKYKVQVTYWNGTTWAVNDIYTKDVTTTSAAYNNLAVGTWGFRVTAGNEAGWSTSNANWYKVSVNTPPPTAVPTNVRVNNLLTVSANVAALNVKLGTNLTLTWDSVANATKYRIEPVTWSNSTWIVDAAHVKEIPGTTVSYNNLSNTRYGFRITAGNSAGWSTSSTTWHNVDILLGVTFDPNGANSITDSKASVPYNSINGTRGENQLVVYNNGGARTGTNEWGIEIIVSADNKVTSIGAYGEGNSLIPAGGMVISAHGATTLVPLLNANVSVGDYITVDSGKVYIWSSNAWLARNKMVNTGLKYKDLPTISRAGYNFEGWYTAATGGTRVTSDDVVTAANNHTLFARWAEITPTSTTVTRQGQNHIFDITITDPIANSAVIVATYDGNSRLIEFKHTTLPVGKNAVQLTAKNTLGATNAKVMIWTNLTTAQPLCAPEIIPALP